MEYQKIPIGKLTFWTSQPKNWEELAYTLNEEPKFLSYDPNNIEVDPTIKNMFL